MRVHTRIGSGFQEVVYQRSLAIEMEKAGLSFDREYEMDLFYKDRKVGTRRVDFFIERAVMIEIKAVATLEFVHLAQAKNYLEASEMDIGLLINFG